MATFSYHTAYSDACSDNGDGQCDGIVPDEEMDAIPDTAEYGITEECGCPCHDAFDGDFADAQTVAEMEAAHRAYHKRFPTSV